MSTGFPYSSFGVHPLAGAAVLGGSALLIVPAIVGALAGKEHRGVCLTFGAVWSTMMLAAVVGDYPTPIVGYGGSAIVGYLLSLAMLPKVARPALGTVGGGHAVRPTRHDDALYTSSFFVAAADC